MLFNYYFYFVFNLLIWITTIECYLRIKPVRNGNRRISFQVGNRRFNNRANAQAFLIKNRRFVRPITRRPSISRQLIPRIKVQLENIKRQRNLNKNNLKYLLQLLASLNDYRSIHNVSDLNDNQNLDNIAQTYSETLARNQNGVTSDPDTTYGESLAEVEEAQVQFLASTWYEQGKNYDYTLPNGDPNARDFTAMIWKTTTDAGIGIVKGTNNKVYIVVKYHPKGNIDGQYTANVFPLQPTCFNTSLNVFLGIPYAKAPVRELRFKAPRNLEETKRSTPFKAYKLRNSCYQPIVWKNFTSWDMFNPTNNMSEDCLRLNIYHPSSNKGVNTSAIVFFHGGDYKTGSITSDIYNASILAVKTNSTIITVNYRLGIFGFAYFGPNYTDVPGNMGLLDQQLALKWVKKNIANITGTNKTKITLFGQGVGGASATAHLFAKNSSKLFNRIIATSGTIYNRWAITEGEFIALNSETTAFMFNCTPAYNITNMVECLQNVSAEKLLNESAYIKPLSFLPQWHPALTSSFTPIYSDNLFFGDDMRFRNVTESMKKKVDLMIGKVSNESTIFMPLYFNSPPFNCSFNYKSGSGDECNMDNVELFDLFNATLTKLFIPSNLTHDFVKLYNNSVVGNNRDKVAHLISDLSFDCDIIKYALRYKNLSTSKNTYFFNYRRNSSFNLWPSWMGIVHRSDLEPEFGLPFKNRSLYDQIKLEEEKEFSEQFMEILGSFAKTGNPGNFWKPYNNITKQALVFESDFSNYTNERRRVRQKIMERIRGNENNFTFESFNTTTCEGIENIYTNYLKNLTEEFYKYYDLLEKRINGTFNETFYINVNAPLNESTVEDSEEGFTEELDANEALPTNFIKVTKKHNNS
uniref:Acetylcholinesterase n=1 Tax=Parastrongyloides trichosuri TaxID=131310 RepID=A0A0N4ZZT0_PARTI